MPKLVLNWIFHPTAINIVFDLSLTKYFIQYIFNLFNCTSDYSSPFPKNYALNYR